MAAKAVVRDVGRVLGHPYGFVDQIAKLIPFELGMTLERALADDGLKERYKADEDVRSIIDLARKLEGLARNAGRHAGGVVIAKAINRFASLLSALSRGHIDDPEFAPILRRDLEDGQHRGLSDDLGYFTTAFFHRPEELEAEVVEAGFVRPDLYAVQGPGLAATDLDERMSDSVKRTRLLDWIRCVEQEPTLIGMSKHFVVAATK